MNEIEINIQTKFDDYFVDPSETTATVKDVLKPKKFYDYDGNLVEGEIETYDEVTSIIPTKEKQTFETENKYITSNLDVEPIPENYADISEVTANGEDVLLGKKFVNNQGELVEGELLADPNAYGEWTLYYDEIDLNESLNYTPSSSSSISLKTYDIGNDEILIVSNKGSIYYNKNTKEQINYKSISIGNIRDLFENNDDFCIITGDKGLYFDKINKTLKHLSSGTTSNFKKIDETRYLGYSDYSTTIYIIDINDFSTKSISMPSKIGYYQTDSSSFVSKTKFGIMNYDNPKQIYVFNKSDLDYNYEIFEMNSNLRYVNANPNFDKIVLVGDSNSAIYNDGASDYYSVIYNFETEIYIPMFTTRSYSQTSMQGCFIYDDYLMQFCGQGITGFFIDFKNDTFTAKGSIYINYPTWIGNYYFVGKTTGSTGFYIFDKNNQFQQLSNAGGANSSNLYSYVETENAIYYTIGTISKNSFKKLDKTTNVITTIGNNIAASIKMYNGEIYMSDITGVRKYNLITEEITELLGPEIAKDKFGFVIYKNNLYLSGYSTYNFKTGENVWGLGRNMSGDYINGIYIDNFYAIDTITRKIFPWYVSNINSSPNSERQYLKWYSYLVRNQITYEEKLYIIDYVRGEGE